MATEEASGAMAGPAVFQMVGGFVRKGGDFAAVKAALVRWLREEYGAGMQRACFRKATR